MKKLKLDTLKVQSFVPVSRDTAEWMLGGHDVRSKTFVDTGFSGNCCGGQICTFDR